MVHTQIFLAFLAIGQVTQVIGLSCYTCDGKKGQCDSSADPGQETSCPSVFSLIRPSVMIALGITYKKDAFNSLNPICSDQKFRDTSGNRTDETLKNVLLSTFSGMFSTIPFLAVTKVL